ncbi:germination protease [Clostridia bacterium]|nr:germination protease [Clostridia bacterium]
MPYANARRTDLAVEAHEIWRENAEETTALPGVEARGDNVEGYDVTRVRILDEQGAEIMGKPKGLYVTLELGDFFTRSHPEAFNSAVRALAGEMRNMHMLAELDDNLEALAVGLGNRQITPDAVGPLSMEHVMVTRHLVSKLPDMFGHMRQVSALTPGVLGTTGMESAEIIRGVIEKINPGLVVIVDALASRKLSRLCSTIQIADTGIVPGSGVGNARAALNYETLGVPVLAVGVPTVVDAATMAADLMEEAGLDAPDPEILRRVGNGLIVTPKEIDARTSDVARVVGYAINLALHPELGVDDVTNFLS